MPCPQRSNTKLFHPILSTPKESQAINLPNSSNELAQWGRGAHGVIPIFPVVVSAVLSWTVAPLASVTLALVDDTVWRWNSVTGDNEVTLDGLMEHTAGTTIWYLTDNHLKSMIHVTSMDGACRWRLLIIDSASMTGRWGHGMGGIGWGTGSTGGVWPLTIL